MSPLRITLGSSPSVPTILSRNPVVRKTGVGVIIQYVEQQVTVLGTIGTTHFYRPVVKRIITQRYERCIEGSNPSGSTTLGSLVKQVLTCR